MSVELRVVLLVVSLLAVWYVARKIKKSQMQLLDAAFWIIVASILFVFGIFPMVPISIAHLLHIDSPANFVFLVMIFISILKIF